MARGPLMSAERSYVCVGELPRRRGLWLYELDQGVFRVLGKIVDEESAHRLRSLSLRSIRYKDLEEGLEVGGKPTMPFEPREKSSLLNR